MIEQNENCRRNEHIMLKTATTVANKGLGRIMLSESLIFLVQQQYKMASRLPYRTSPKIKEVLFSELTSRADVTQ